MIRLVRRAAGTAVLSMVAGLALIPAGVASAQSGNLLANPTFAGGTTSGWTGTNATLSVASPGFDSGDSFAASVKRSGSSAYSISATPQPATNVAALTQLQGSGEVLGNSGRSICLMLQEFTSSGSLVQTQKQCVTANGSWQAIGPANLTDKNAGDSVGFQIRQTGAQAGDSFQADSLSLTEPPPPSAPTVSGNVADWPMQETSGTTMTDISGNGSNGTLVGPVQVGQPGPGGSTGLTYAYSFPGSSARSTVDVPYSPTLVAGTQNIDISFWFNTTYLPSSGDFDLARMGVYPYPEYKIELYPQNNIQCTFHGSNSSNHTTGGSNLANGQWHFVQCVKTASQIQLFIDGVLVGTTSAVIGSVSPGQDAFFGAHGLPGTSSGYDWYHGGLTDAEFSFSSPLAVPASRSPAVAAAASQAPARQPRMKQAELAYLGITGPGNALAGRLARAASGTTLFSQFRADALAYAKELGSETGKLRAVHWPASVQSRISTLVTTTFPADIRCLQAVAAAGSMAASQTVSSNNKDCQVADNSPVPTSI